MRNLHVVFTMNPSSEGLKDRAATSPALFNRCVLNWFGDWSTGALYQVGLEFTNKVDLDKSDVRCNLDCCVNIKFKLAHSYNAYTCLPSKYVISVKIMITLTLAVNAALNVQDMLY